MNEQDRKEIEVLIAGSRDAIVCSVDGAGFPNAKAMFLRAREGTKVFWFSTNVSAERTRQLTDRPEACVYFFDPERIRGLMLTGHMAVHRDAETKEAYWQEGDERYYSLGPTDPDYCMMRFTAEKGNYWGGGKRVFEVE
jgi:general stress protein 26